MDGSNHDATDAEAHRCKFESLYRLHREAIYRYCLRRLHDPELAEDARSAVFVEAWRRRAAIDFDDRAALPWLYGVAKNVLRNQRRTLRRREAALTRLPRPISDFESVEDADDRLDAARAARHARELIAALPAGERAVVLMCLANELSYTTAAHRLGVPVGTVRSRLARARGRLTCTALRSAGPTVSGRDQ
jgi:RNA polymerase sigma factor (sigma-70 family)